jgi:tRNA uridine 5-carbamoylmethylation protein Kti12
MIKNLIFINGTMGVGKTTTSKELQKMLPNCIFLDGDWCWDMSPFIVTDETQKINQSRIRHFELIEHIRCEYYKETLFIVEKIRGIIYRLLLRHSFSGMPE